MKRMKALAALLLCANLLCGLPCMGAEKQESPAWDGKTLDISWYTPEAERFYISTPEQLMGLSALVNGLYNASIEHIVGNFAYLIDHKVESETADRLGKSTQTYHYGADDFRGKTVCLTADLDMGGRLEQGVWSGPNYLPIGGQYLMERNDPATKLGSSFCGTLDGQGHTIVNIFCDRRCTTGAYGDGQSIGVIGRIGVHDGEKDLPVRGAVRDLACTGSICGNRSVGGIVGKIGKTVEGVCIERCANFASVHSLDAKGCGGIVGAGWNGGVIRSCYNAGSISSEHTGPVGGIAGSCECDVYNCYSVGTISGADRRKAMAIGTANGVKTRVENCYWLTGSAPGGGYYDMGTSSQTELTRQEMTADGFPAMLGGDFVPDRAGLNQGYPILKWQENTVLPQSGKTDTLPYTDVSPDAWSWSAVHEVSAAGLFTEVTPGCFAPEAPMTRLMLAQALYRRSGAPATDTGGVFSDVSDPAVDWAYSQGIVLGVSPDRFDPDGSVTREQLAAMFYRYARWEGKTQDTYAVPGFTDWDQVSGWAEDPMRWAVGTGLLNGTGGGLLQPQGTATRAQAAQIMVRFAD